MKKTMPTFEATLLLLESINHQFLTPDELSKIKEKIHQTFAIKQEGKELVAYK